MPNTLFVLTTAFTLFGIGFFCVDWYRNRSKRLSHFEAISDVTGLELSDGMLQKENEITHHAVHAASERIHTIGEGVGHHIETIAHTLSHH